VYVSPMLLEELKGLVSDLELLDRLRTKIDRYRKISEHTEGTLDRLLGLASKVLCPQCRGYGTTMTGNICQNCNGSGHLLHLLPSDKK